MADPQSTPADDGESPAADEGTAPAADPEGDGEELSTEQLREQVEQKYDFDDFGPEDMAEMSADEWEAAFDPDTWITGAELLDRVEADLKHRVVIRDVFARVERVEDEQLVAYSDEGYAAVYPDGTVEGHGTVLRDVKPVVALCSMEEYDVPEMPEGEVLPQPAEVPEGSGELGNIVVQIVAGVQVLAGLGLFLSWFLFVVGILQPPAQSVGQDLNLTLMVVAGLAFIGVGILLFTVVANARLSDKFRAEEYRNRLRAVGIDSDERPEFLPDEENAPNRLETSETPADSTTEDTDQSAEGDESASGDSTGTDGQEGEQAGQEGGDGGESETAR